MQPDPSDRSLRDMVAELAGLGDGDLREILAELTPSERARVEDLLASYSKKDEAPAPAVQAEPQLDTSGLSPWLAARLEEPGRQAKDAPRGLGLRLARRAPTVEAEITAAARETLKACVAATLGYREPPAKPRSLGAWWANRLARTSGSRPA